MRHSYLVWGAVCIKCVASWLQQQSRLRRLITERSCKAQTTFIFLLSPLSSPIPSLFIVVRCYPYLLRKKRNEKCLLNKYDDKAFGSLNRSALSVRRFHCLDWTVSIVQPSAVNSLSIESVSRLLFTLLSAACVRLQCPMPDELVALCGVVATNGPINTLLEIGLLNDGANRNVGLGGHWFVLATKDRHEKVIPTRIMRLMALASVATGCRP